LHVKVTWSPTDYSTGAFDALFWPAEAKIDSISAYFDPNLDYNLHNSSNSLTMNGHLAQEDHPTNRHSPEGLTNGHSAPSAKAAPKKNGTIVEFSNGSHNSVANGSATNGFVNTNKKTMKHPSATYSNDPYDHSQNSQNLIEILKKSLANEIQEYAIPSKFLIEDSLPRLPNGKLDRKSLQEAAERDAFVSRIETRTIEVSSLSKAMISLWEELLDVRGIGLDETFQQLGGNSITLNFLQSKVNTKFGIFLTFKEMWALKTVRSMTQFIEPNVKVSLTVDDDQSTQTPNDTNPTSNSNEEKEKENFVAGDNLLSRLDLDLPSQYLLILQNDFKDESKGSGITVPECLEKKYEAFKINPDEAEYQTFSCG